MLCPVDQARLVMADRQGVEIDYCPVCRGVWLDRGELDKILERSGGGAAAAPPAPVPGYGQPAPGGYDPRRDDRRDDRRGYDDRAAHDSRGYDPRRKKKRESWLEDLFDF
ncbi:zf-TFIIB domain-containing protein [Cellulomonas soli]|uniref:TFIIB-type zinc ribbon-containing protein n=1 Tax=Cellulomonas soli TaxID=931535 RepID=UPI003F82FF4E